MVYKYDVIPLTEGLDFNTATSLSKPGSLRDCMNYEYVDGAGLRRINGFRPYDGTNLSQTDKLYILSYTGTISGNSVYQSWPWLYVEDTTSNPNKVPFGYVLNGASTFPSYTSGMTTTTYIPFVKINCPAYADPFHRPFNTIKLLNSALLTLSADAAAVGIKTPGELDSNAYNAIFGTTTKSAVTELLYIKNYSTEISNNMIRTAQAGAGATPMVEPASFSQIVDVWVEELKGKTYSISDALRVAGTANGLQIYPGDYLYGRTAGGADFNEPWLVLKATATAWTVGEAVVLELAPLKYNTFTSSNDSYKKPHGIFYDQVRGDIAPTTLRLYRNSGTNALENLSWPLQYSDVALEYGSTLGIMYARESEEKALTADSVAGTNSVSITGGTGHRYAWDVSSGASSGVNYTDADGDAEYMPLVASGVIKSVIPTKPGAGYTTTTGTVTYTAGTGGASGASTTYRAKAIERIYPRFLHTGWIVPFDAGNKASGFLNKIDRYKDRDGTTYTSSLSLTGLNCTTYLHAIANNTLPYTGASNQARIFNDNWVTTSGSSSSSADIVSAIGTDDGTTITNSYNWGRYPTSSIAFTSTSGFVGFGNIATQLPEDCVIRGVAVKVSVQVSASTDSSTIYTDGGATLRAFLFKNGGAQTLGSPIEMLSGSGTLKDTWNGNTMIETVFTAGSSSELFGNSPLRLEDLLDPTFGVGFDIRLERANSGVTPTGTFLIDNVEFEIYYEEPSVRLYFADNASEGSRNVILCGDVVDYTVSKGSFLTGDAEGYMTVVNLRTLRGPANTTSSTPYHTILNNYIIYQDPKLTLQVGLTSGDMEFNGFDSYRSIKAQGSLYTSVRANLYSNADYDAFYICSGAGRARIFDGKYMTRVYAINPGQENSEDLDKPRHAAITNFSLFLGYESGQVLFSAPGEPSNFSAFDGAGEIGIGDNVVGLQRMPGNSLCVACRNSMHAIVGTSAQDYSLQTLVADEGAYEYSVVAVGPRIVYSSNSGVTTLDQSEKYGNFLARRLSYKINPWLLPRMSASAVFFRQPTRELLPSDGGMLFVRAHAVPYKNQYRLYFKDGTQLWLTILEDMAEATFVRYHYPDPDTDPFARWYRSGAPYPLYITTTVEKEQYIPYKTICVFDPESVVRGVGADYGYAAGSYILDAGDFFCTQGPLCERTSFPHHFAVNYTYLQNPFTKKTIRKVRIEGQTLGYAPLKVFAKDGYQEDYEDVYATTGTPMAFPSSPMDEIKTSPIPGTVMANVAATGRELTILVTADSVSTNLWEAIPTDNSPSHYCQALFIQYEEGGEDA